MLTLLICTLLTAPPEGHIAYLSGTIEAEQRVVIVDIASQEIEPIGPGKADGPPQWSPNGEWLAFDTQTDSGRAIYLVRFDGSDGRYLNHTHAFSREPAWSADSAGLAYTVGRGPKRQIAVYTIATDQEQIWGGDQKGLRSPKWLMHSLVEALLSPDDTIGPGFERVFNRSDKDLVGLVAVGESTTSNLFSTDLFLVTEHETMPFPAIALPTRGDYAEWNPVPARRTHAIAFESDDGGDRELFIIARKGVWDLSNHRAADWNPVWSPDDSWLAFESFRSGHRGVFRVHRDSALVLPVAVSSDADNGWPTWAPKGKWIAFVSDRSGSRNLYVTDLKGRETIQLTHGTSGAGAPAWRPSR